MSKGQHRPKVNNLGAVSKIINFHPIDLKFEQDLHFRWMNSTTYYFWGYHRPKGQNRSKGQFGPTFIKLSIFIRLIWNLKRNCISCPWIQPPINFMINISQKVKIGQKAKFPKSSIFIQLSSNLNRMYISGHLIQPPIIFVVTIGEKVDINQKVNIGQISKILNFNPNNLKFEEHLHIRSLDSTTH